MKRIVIVCEGPTEQEFCNNVLLPEFIRHDITIEAPAIKHSHGGIVPWGTLRKQLVNHLYESDVHVSMLIDYYGIKDDYKFPGWQESKTIQDKQERMHFLFDRMREDLPAQLQNRFLPYIQLHEFEGLLFSDIDVLQHNFMPYEIDIKELQEAADKYPNPELINDHPNTAPSKRLGRAICGYEKVLYGNLLAMDIGLEKIREKCPLFNEWIITMLTTKR